MKIQINLELIPAPPENGTHVNDIYFSLCDGCFFYGTYCDMLATPTQTVGDLCTLGKNNFIWKEIENAQENS